MTNLYLARWAARHHQVPDAPTDPKPESWESSIFSTCLASFFALLLSTPLWGDWGNLRSFQTVGRYRGWLRQAWSRKRVDWQRNKQVNQSKFIQLTIVKYPVNQTKYNQFIQTLTSDYILSQLTKQAEKGNVKQALHHSPSQKDQDDLIARQCVLDVKGSVDV